LAPLRSTVQVYKLTLINFIKFFTTRDKRSPYDYCVNVLVIKKIIVIDTNLKINHIRTVKFPGIYYSSSQQSPENIRLLFRCTHTTVLLLICRCYADFFELFLTSAIS
jgi:hypothetical protein